MLLLLMMMLGLGIGGDLEERVRKWVLEMMKFTTVEVEFGIVDFQCKSTLLCSTFNSLRGFFLFLFLIHIRTNFC